MRIGNKEFDTENETYVMGILNLTPDSFFDGGKYHEDLDVALFHTQEMLNEGADILDVGGESTRPDYVMITCEEEIERVASVIEAIKDRLDIPVSIDTYKSRVAKAAIAAGADMVNDIWGLQYDSEMAKLIADNDLPCCLMHNRKEAEYTNLMDDMVQDLKQSIQIAEEAGISQENIILDPGIGFGKRYNHNLEALNKLERLHLLGRPLLLGASAKSVIGNTLDVPKEERLEGTLVTTALAVAKGCTFVRVHEVLPNVKAIQMARAIKRA